MNLPLYQRLNELICIRNTGPVEVLAEKLKISPRQVKYIINKMRQDCEAPIWFDNARQSYVYTQNGRCDFKFRANSKEIVTEAIDEALKKYFTPLILAWYLLPDLIKEIAILSLAV